MQMVTGRSSSTLLVWFFRGELKNGSAIGDRAAPERRVKIDYMQEVRAKFNLDKKQTGLMDWERISRSSSN